MVPLFQIQNLDNSKEKKVDLYYFFGAKLKNEKIDKLKSSYDTLKVL